MALIAAPPVVPVFAAGGGGGPPMLPTRSRARTDRQVHAQPFHPQGQEEATSSRSSSDPAFIQGYRAAYSTIYDRNDYAAAIEQLKALGHDDYANVANLIGYSYRKLGDYRLSPSLVRARAEVRSEPCSDLEYYGLWQIEQGNREQALYHLSRIAAICGTDCAALSLAGCGARTAARHRSGLLIVR